MASTPSWTGTPRIGAARLTTANTNLTSPANAVQVFEAGASGSRIHRIDIVQSDDPGAADANWVQLYWYNGSTYILWRVVDFDATDIADITVPTSVTLLFPEGLPVPGGSGFTKLYAATYESRSVDVTAYGGDY